MSADREALRAWLSLLATGGALKKSIDAAFRAHFGLSISRFDALAAIERAGPDGLRAGELSQRLMVTEGNVTQLTAALSENGLIWRSVCRSDGRVAIFRLTKKGQSVFADMAQAHRRWVGAAFADLTGAQLADFRKLLGKVNFTVERSGARKDAA